MNCEGELLMKFILAYYIIHQLNSPKHLSVRLLILILVL